MNKATGGARRGGVPRGRSWTHEAEAALCAALILHRSFGCWERNGRKLLAESLRIIANHSRSVVAHVEALALLERLERLA